MTGESIAVTGATGALGSRVAQRLAAHGLTPRLVVRAPERATAPPGSSVARAPYDDPALLRAAFADVETLFLVSAGQEPERVALHRQVVEAAAATGVRRVVYTSFLSAAPDATFTFARDHWHTEQAIRACGIAFTFLRNSIYQDLLPYFVEGGEIRGPAGDGRVAAVTRDDIADVADAVLRSRDYDGTTLDVTGPAALSAAEIADTLTRVTGRTVRYVPETREEAYASRAHYGAPDWEVTGWVTSYEAIAEGELSTVSNTVERVTGHPPLSFERFLVAHHTSSGARLGW